MRVLLVHNFYGFSAPSGENTAYCGERELLRAAGCEVEEFVRHSDELRSRGVSGMLHGAAVTAWNPTAAKALRRRVAAVRPDVVHVHNTFPLISPAIFHALRDADAAVVMTTHNYRIACASAMLSRDGQPCTLCVDAGSVWPALRHRCYRHSLAATLPLAASLALHRRLGTWRRHVDAFIALTGFQKELLVRAGLPGERIHVKPNVFGGEAAIAPWHGRRPRVAFVGRLSPEKGLETLLDAWRAWGTEAPGLDVVGAGPGMDAARAYVDRHGLASRITLHGALPPERTLEIVAASCLLVVPSRVFEGYPMVIAEAFAHAVPVAASDIGSLRSIVTPGDNGLHFPAGDAAALLTTVRGAWREPGLLESLAGGARRTYERSLAPQANLEVLRSTYAAAGAVRRARREQKTEA